MLNAIFVTTVVFVSLPLASSECQFKYCCSNIYNSQISNIVLCLLADLDPALVGLSLAYVLSLAGVLQYVVRQSAEVESLVSLSHNYIFLSILVAWSV